MISDFLKKNITSQANCVEYGYAQVEPNHLSAKEQVRFMLSFQQLLKLMFLKMVSL